MIFINRTIRVWFELLIRRYHFVLYKISRSYGFNHQDAQDLIQEPAVGCFAVFAMLPPQALPVVAFTMVR